MNDAHLRLSDAERDQAATALGEHFAQGRLTTDEHAERLDRIWAARTRGELEPVFRDLPDPKRAAMERRTSRSGPPAYWSSGFRRRGPLPPPIFVVFAVLVALTIVTHVPFVLVGLFAVLFVAMRRRRRATHWAGHP